MSFVLVNNELAELYAQVRAHPPLWQRNGQLMFFSANAYLRNNHCLLFKNVWRCFHCISVRVIINFIEMPNQLTACTSTFYLLCVILQVPTYPRGMTLLRERDSTEWVPFTNYVTLWRHESSRAVCYGTYIFWILIQNSLNEGVGKCRFVGVA